MDALPKNFDDRIQNHLVALLLRTVFDFRRMPLGATLTEHSHLLYEAASNSCPVVAALEGGYVPEAVASGLQALAAALNGHDSLAL